MPEKLEKPKYPIDLAKSVKDLEGPTTAGEKLPDKIYPSLYLEWERPYGFPDSGTMTVKFKKRSEENRKRGEKTMQRVELDILSILDTEAGKNEEKEEESTGDRLDEEVKKVQKKKGKSEKNSDEDESIYS